MEKAAFSKVMALFTSKLDVNLKKEQKLLHLENSIYGAENWTIRIVAQKCLQGF